MQHALDVLAALNDPTRLKVLLLVRDIELSMGELAELLGQSQPRVSRHVRILSEAGLVRRLKEGAWVFVAPGTADSMRSIYALVEALTSGQDPIAVERARLRQVRDARQAAADAWFAANAGEWDHMRALHGADGVVDAALLRALEDRPVGRLLDVGTGTGRVIELVNGRATSAIGVDRSPEMLRLARARLDAAGLGSVLVRQADMSALPFDNGAFDTVVMNQVLHFASDPGGVLQEAARVLGPGGQLLIADYAAHEREELRERYRHARLGFETAAMLRWLEAAGLDAEEVGTHPGPGLTVKLWRGANTKRQEGTQGC